ncbi:MAG: Type 1 glutamine amidotransferase-like domain-containing protein [Lachnospiraceae bacterium]|nr:Type 1 glutamine amidotransferase-like domain-containing protein [Lachnospiraceae bacterium]
MKAILTSTFGASVKVDGKWIGTAISEENGLRNKVKSIWPEQARVLMIFASPDNYERNDSIYACYKDAFLMSGLSISAFEGCDDRNEAAVEHLSEIDVIILAGGHVPAQNEFLKRLGLKEKLKAYDGIVLAWSAGSMNCAETVYAAPEREGEALDPKFERFIPGLGLTETKIFPHFQSLKDEMLDGMRVIEDITYGDSHGREFLALNDGSYLFIEDETETVSGEAYRIRDGRQELICNNGEAVEWKTM